MNLKKDKALQKLNGQCMEGFRSWIVALFQNFEAVKFKLHSIHDINMSLSAINGRYNFFNFLCAADTDYSSEQFFELAFSNNMTTNNITISIFDDNISELEETFTLTLDVFEIRAGERSRSADERSRLLFNIRTTVVSIQDDDGMQYASRPCECTSE